MAGRCLVTAAIAVAIATRGGHAQTGFPGGNSFGGGGGGGDNNGGGGGGGGGFPGFGGGSPFGQGGGFGGGQGGGFGGGPGGGFGGGFGGGPGGFGGGPGGFGGGPGGFGGGFGGMGGGPFGGFGGGFGAGSLMNLLRPPFNPILSCIDVNPIDPTAQLRLTIRLEGGDDNGNGNDFNGMFGNNGGDVNNDENRSRNWIVEGIITPGAQTLSGTYNLVVTQYGRHVNGQCFAEELGPAIQGSNPTLTGQINGALGQLGPLGAMLLGNQIQQRQQPAGVLSNPIILSGGVSSYTGRLNGATFNQINGGGIAFCQQYTNGQCIGKVPLCCSITRDQVPATQTMVSRGLTAGAISVKPWDFDDHGDDRGGKSSIGAQPASGLSVF